MTQYDVYTCGKHVVHAGHHMDEDNAYAAYRVAIASLNVSE